MLQYMYELDYEVGSLDETVPDIYAHVYMWILAVELGIKGLKIVAAEKIQTRTVSVQRLRQRDWLHDLLL